MNNALKNIIMAVLFVVFMAMIVIGQKTIGYTSLLMMLLGLGGLLLLLYLYNRKYK